MVRLQIVLNAFQGKENSCLRQLRLILRYLYPYLTEFLCSYFVIFIVPYDKWTKSVYKQPATFVY